MFHKEALMKGALLKLPMSKSFSWVTNSRCAKQYTAYLEQHV